MLNKHVKTYNDRQRHCKRYLVNEITFDTYYGDDLFLLEKDFN